MTLEITVRPMEALSFLLICLMILFLIVVAVSILRKFWG